jgi:hypothetical protein
MADLEQQLKEINEKADKEYINRVRKDLIERYCFEHFGDDFKIDKTRAINSIRAEVLGEIDKRLGKAKKDSNEGIKPSPELVRKNILFRKFEDDHEKNLPDYEDVFNEDGTPKFVLCISNKTIWEPSPGMLKSLGKEFEPCDKDGIIRRVEDYGKEHK